MVNIKKLAIVLLLIFIFGCKNLPEDATPTSSVFEEEIVEDIIEDGINKKIEICGNETGEDCLYKIKIYESLRKRQERN